MTRRWQTLLAGLALCTASGCSSDAGTWPGPCGLEPEVQELLAGMDADRWLGRVQELSGARPVLVGGSETTLATRYTPALFSGAAHAQAFPWLLEQLRASWPEEALEIHEYREKQVCEVPAALPGPAAGALPGSQGAGCTGWRNLALTIRGRTRPEESVLLTAHLDSLVIDEGAWLRAPGANDNASGAATLLELALLLPGHAPARTLQLIWFTGEEEGIVGSAGWTMDHDLSGVRGVVNLDMLGAVGASRTLEVHDDGRAVSLGLAECACDLLTLHGLALEPRRFSGPAADGTSDHSSFWHAGLGAILLTTGFSDPQGHREGDTADRIVLPQAFEAAQAAAATALTLALQ